MPLLLRRALLLLLLVRTFHAQQLVLMRDATTGDGKLLLTKNKGRSVGRVMHGSPIPLCESNPTVSRFNTSFVFSISSSSRVTGEGLAFTIAGDLSLPPAASFGSWLGLFDENTNRKDNRIVGIEFDAVKSSGQDTNNNHVGIDVNQIQSWVSPSLESVGVDLHTPSSMFKVWIEYENKTIQVFVSQNIDQKPQTPIILPQEVDLCDRASINGSSYVGFSAATENTTESTAGDVYQVHSWSFTSGSDGASFEFQTFPDIGIRTGSNSSGGGSNKTGVIAVAVLVPVLAILLLVACCCCYSPIIVYVKTLSEEVRESYGSESLRLRKDLEHNMSPLPSEISYSDLRKATSNFSHENILGQGGFGLVYIGQLPTDQSQVAVKRVSEDSRQGEREFLAEVQIITRLSHRNLVPLRGWCCRSRELLLVYDFMPNGSLDKALFDPRSTPLDWEKRVKIIHGLASALLYLHEGCEQKVVHRDVKPSNVLLDSEFNSRLGDFGLARLINRNRDAKTTTMAGTIGYLAPEINITGKSTPASDVYSFGIVVLGVTTGRKPFNPGSDEWLSLVEWLWELHHRERTIEAADPRLKGEFESEEMKSLINLGLACSDPNPRTRPTMQVVVSVLGGDANNANLPELRTQSSQLMRSSSFSISDGSFPRLTFASIASISKT